MIILTADEQLFIRKPTDEETSIISNRMIAVDGTIHDIAYELARGRTWSPAYYVKNYRHTSAWEGQQLFAIDIDQKKDYLSFADCLKRAKAFGVLPAFAYATFSARPDLEKYRVVFCLPQEINDFRLQRAVQLALLRLFPECDPACKDLARLFYGGTQLIYEDYEAHLDVLALVDGMCQHIYATDKKNAARKINDYCHDVGLNQKNGLPYVERVQEQEPPLKESSTAVIANSLYINTSGENLTGSGSAFAVFHFTEQATEAQARTEKKYAHVESIKIDRKLIRYVDWEALKERCPVYRLFMSGDVDLDHTIKFGLATNLVCLEGGETKFFEGLAKRPENDSNKWRNDINYINKRQYAPMRYASYYPEAEVITGARSLVEAAKLKRGTVRTMSQPTMKVLSEAEAEMEQAFNRMLAAEDGIYVLKAPTGIGKTRLYEKLPCAVIAVPTHKLKTEVAERMRAVGNDAITSPELPEGLDDKIVDKLEHLYATGAIHAANRYLRELDDPRIKDYITQKDDVSRIHDRTVVTTHARLPYLHMQQDVIIVDEDIISTLLSTGSTTVKDLEAVQRHYVFRAFGHELTKDETTFTSMLAFVQEAKPHLVYAMPTFILDVKPLEQAVVRSKIKSNAVDFVTCTHFIKHVDGSIHFINRNELPYKKVIILSATANETVYRALFGEKLTFIDIGLVETKGRIVQDTRRMFSRSQLRDNQYYLEEITRTAGDTSIITFKEFKDRLDNVVATFGATLGLNEFAGRDLVIAGTPALNEETYLLYAAALGIRLNPKETMDYIVVQRNGFEYRFMTYTANEQLREIQLHLIESELIQAIGRARVLRNDCTVTVLSTLPITGAEFLN